MAENTRSLTEVVATLQKDAGAPYPRYPSQSIHAVHDDRVMKSLTRRLDQGAKLRDVRALEYDFTTGLNRICFEFDSAGPMAGGDDLLVLLDGNCRVIGLVDPFDAKQPNRMVPPLAALSGALPFVLDRPSAGCNMPFEQADLTSQEGRAREFIAMAGIGGFGWRQTGGGGGDPCGPEAHTTMCTYCSFFMGTLQYLPATRFDRSIRTMDCSQMDTNSDDCGTGIG